MLVVSLMLTQMATTAVARLTEYFGIDNGNANIVVFSPQFSQKSSLHNVTHSKKKTKNIVSYPVVGFTEQSQTAEYEFST